MSLTVDFNYIGRYFIFLTPVLCYIFYDANLYTMAQEEVISLITLITTFIISVIAGVIANYISKMLDRKSDKEA